MRHRLFATWVTVGILALRLPAASLPSGVAADHLVQGTLANGLKYAVLPHAGPRGETSLRLVVLTGSLDEDEHERGFAHFVEHMAFNGTRRHPAGSLPPLLESWGLRSGADSNAFTSATTTTYLLDLPEENLPQVPEALALLRDYADGILFSPAEVDRERGVVLSEIQVRDQPGAQIAAQVRQLLFSGTKLTDRDPGGLPGQVQGATADALRAYYQRCYQPGRMTVVVVGPVDPEAVIRQISAEFGSIAARPTTPPAARSVIPPRPALKANVIVTPAMASNQVTLYSLQLRGPEDDATRQSDVTLAVAVRALNMRLTASREKLPSGAVSSASVIVRPNLGGRVSERLLVAQSAGPWDAAVALLASELDQVRKGGFTPAEVREAVAVLKGSVEHRLTSLPSTASRALASDIAQSFGAERAWHDPVADVARIEQTLEHIDAAAATAAMQEAFPPNTGELVLIVRRSKPDDPEKLLAAWTRPASAIAPSVTAATPPAEPEMAESTEVSTPSTKDDDARLRFAYTDFGPPGKIDHQRRESDLGLDLVAFTNGVLLNVRPSKSQPKSFTLMARLGRGLADVPKNLPTLPVVATSLIFKNPLRRHSYSEATRLLALHDVRLRISYNQGCGTLLLSGPSSELEFAFQMLAALLGDLKVDPSNDRAVIADAVTKLASGSLATRATDSALYAAADNDPRMTHSRQTTLLTTIGLTTAKGWLKQRWLEGPLEIGLVGDVSTDESVRFASRTVATLPKRGPRTPSTPDPKFVFASHAGTSSIDITSTSAAAATSVVWPLWVHEDGQSACVTQLAGAILREHLFAKLRHDLGATYSPSVHLWRINDQEDFGFIVAQLSFEPAKARNMTDRVVALADELANAGATEDELNRARHPYEAAAAADLRDNAWWLGQVVSWAQTKPARLEIARRHGDGYQSVTLGDVNSVLKALTKSVATAVIALPAPPTQSTSSASTAVSRGTATAPTVTPTAPKPQP